MKRLALVAAVLVIAACKANEADTTDTATQVAPAPAPADTAMRDTMRDTTRQRP
jgi:uncharacterized lipoprotein YajG